MTLTKELYRNWRNLSYRHFVPHKFHIEGPKFKHGPPNSEVGD